MEAHVKEVLRRIAREIRATGEQAEIERENVDRHGYAGGKYFGALARGERIYRLQVGSLIDYVRTRLTVRDLRGALEGKVVA